MVVRISEMYSDDYDVECYSEGERFQPSEDAIAVSYAILENEDENDAIDGREGELAKGFTYELHEGELCAIVDGKYIPCEDENRFLYTLDQMGYEA